MLRPKVEKAVYAHFLCGPIIAGLVLSWPMTKGGSLTELPDLQGQGLFPSAYTPSCEAYEYNPTEVSLQDGPAGRSDGTEVG